MALPDEKARAYLAQHNILAIFENLCTELVYDKPENPRAYLMQKLTAMQGEAPATSAALFDDAELDTMFGMFDRIQRGTISEQQLRTALQSMGLKANRTIHPDTVFSKEDFKKQVHAAVRA